MPPFFNLISLLKSFSKQEVFRYTILVATIFLLFVKKYNCALLYSLHLKLKRLRSYQMANMEILFQIGSEILFS